MLYHSVSVQFHARPHSNDTTRNTSNDTTHTRYFAHSAVSAAHSSVLPLCGFLGSSFLVVSCFGGLFSVLMSYNTSMFGAKEIAGV